MGALIFYVDYATEIEFVAPRIWYLKMCDAHSKKLLWIHYRLDGPIFSLDISNLRATEVFFGIVTSIWTKKFQQNLVLCIFPNNIKITTMAPLRSENILIS